jgi:hypothetical protein
MKKLVTLIAMAMMAVSANAKLGYWNNSGFVELIPDESFLYKYVQAKDTESQKAIEDLYADMKKRKDKSILKRNEGGWYVKNDYPLPEGNYYESPFYNSSLEAHANELYVVLPEYDLYLNNRGKIDDLLGFLGSKVSVKSEFGPDLSGGTKYRLACNMNTSEEVLETAMNIHDFGFEGLAYFTPQKFWLYRDIDEYWIKLMTDNDDSVENGLILIYEMNWENANYWTCTGFGESHTKQTDEGLAITNPCMQENTWMLSEIIGGPIVLEQGHNYLVRLTMKAPSDGTYRVDLCSWDGSGAQAVQEITLTTNDEFQVIDVTCPDYNASGVHGEEYSDCRVMLGCGWVVGATVVKKVEIYESVSSKDRGHETAMKAVKTLKSDDTIYNLAGQEVSPSYKGVVIRNGKKMFVK